MTNKPEAIIIHHEGASNGFRAVNEWHRQRWNSPSSLGYYIGYHYYIDWYKVWQGRKDTEEGMHTLGGWNRKSIGICLRGNFNLTEPRYEQLALLAELIEKKRREWNISISKVYGHGELWPTSCPGKTLKEWIEKYRGDQNLKTIQRQLNYIQALIYELQRSIKKLIRQ